MKEKKEKRPVGIFEAYAEARKSGKDGEDYCTDRVKDKLVSSCTLACTKFDQQLFNLFPFE